MDIEQMRIRMGEMAAEIERLQGVIDEANAQEPLTNGNAVWAVATGEHYGQHESYTLHDECPALCEGEKLYRSFAVNYDVGLIAEMLEDYGLLLRNGTIDYAHRYSPAIVMDQVNLLLSDPIPAQQSPAVAAPDKETNFCALKSITDSQVNAVARAFWRRIYAYRNDYEIELPKPLPVEFMAHMATALTWVDRDPSPRITEQDAIAILKARDENPLTVYEKWLPETLAKLNGVHHE